MDFKMCFISAAIGNILLHLMYNGQPRPPFNFPLELLIQSFFISLMLISEFLFNKLFKESTNDTQTNG